jgi:hypothetical protein
MVRVAGAALGAALTAPGENTGSPLRIRHRSSAETRSSYGIMAATISRRALYRRAPIRTAISSLMLAGTVKPSVFIISRM